MSSSTGSLSQDPRPWNVYVAEDARHLLSLLLIDLRRGFCAGVSSKTLKGDVDAELAEHARICKVLHERDNKRNLRRHLLRVDLRLAKDAASQARLATLRLRDRDRKRRQRERQMMESRAQDSDYSDDSGPTCRSDGRSSRCTTAT